MNNEEAKTVIALRGCPTCGQPFFIEIYNNHFYKDLPSYGDAWEGSILCRCSNNHCTSSSVMVWKAGDLFQEVSRLMYG